MPCGTNSAGHASAGVIAAWRGVSVTGLSFYFALNRAKKCEWGVSLCVKCKAG